MAEPVRNEYRAALVEMMAEAARGATIVNVGMPGHYPPLARVPLTVIAAAGFGGIQAFRSIWDGAMGRELVEPLRRGPIERVISSGLVASATGTIAALGVGRSAKLALKLGGRIGTAVAAGEVAANLVRAADHRIQDGTFGDRAQELLVSMTVEGGRQLANASTAIRDQVSQAGSAIATAAAAATEAARLSYNKQRARTPPQLPPTDTQPTSVPEAPTRRLPPAQPREPERRAPARRAPPSNPYDTSPVPRPSLGQRPQSQLNRADPRVASGQVKGFWRWRRVADSQRFVREYVQPHSRRVA